MSLIRFLAYATAGVVLLLALGAVRLLQVMVQTHCRAGWPAPRVPTKPAGNQASIALLLGSGGHTAEMVRLLASVDWTRYSSRIYIVTAGDSLSQTRALELEARIGHGEFELLVIPRARHVKQSYVTSPWTTLGCLASCLWQITIRPLLFSKQRRIADVLLLNGPGSCVPVVLCAFLPKLLNLPSTSTVYIESFARLSRLSLSGRLVRPFVDRFFVQWKGLRDNLTEGDSELEGGDGWRLKARVEYQGWFV